MSVPFSIPVKGNSVTYIMNEDGEFMCPHESVEIEYDRGGDGITEPGPSWSVYCSDCHNDDMTDSEMQNILEAHWDNLNDREDERDEY